MNAFAVRQFFRAVARGTLDVGDPEVRALMRELHADRGGVRRRDFSGARLRSAASDGRVSGIASAYGIDYSIGGGMKERVAPGAFAETLRERGAVRPLFYQHDWSDPVGIATFRETSSALTVDADLFVEESASARTVYASAKAGAFDSFSIGFVPTEIDKSERGVEIIRAADLIEVSVVVRPANPGASIEHVA